MPYQPGEFFVRIPDRFVNKIKCEFDHEEFRLTRADRTVALTKFLEKTSSRRYHANWDQQPDLCKPSPILPLTNSRTYET